MGRIPVLGTPLSPTANFVSVPNLLKLGIKALNRAFAGTNSCNLGEFLPSGV